MNEEEIMEQIFKVGDEVFGAWINAKGVELSVIGHILTCDFAENAKGEQLYPIYQVEDRSGWVPWMREDSLTKL